MIYSKKASVMELLAHVRGDKAHPSNHPLTRLAASELSSSKRTTSAGDMLTERPPTKFTDIGDTSGTESC